MKTNVVRALAGLGTVVAIVAIFALAISLFRGSFTETVPLTVISDRAGYINGEMVVQDGGSHLRSSGAEDLLQWTDAQWQKQRDRRPKG